MKLLLGFVLFCAAVSMLVVAALVQLLISLLPFLVVVAAVLLVVRMRRPRHAAVPVARLPARRPQSGGYHRSPPALAPPRPPGWAPGPAGGWVLLPVWVGPPAPRARPPVIDAEVIEEDRRG